MSMARRVDLLPDIYAQKRRDRRIAFVLAMFGLVFMVLGVLWWFVLGSSVDTERQNLLDAQGRTAQIQVQIDELQRFAALDQEVQAKKSALQTVMAGDINWASLLTEIAMVIPEEVWIENLTASAGQTEGAAPVGTEAASIRVSDVTPTGRIQFEGLSVTMPSLAEWLIELNKVDAFGALWLNNASGQTDENGDVQAFNFSSTLELTEAALSGRYQGDLP